MTRPFTPAVRGAQARRGGVRALPASRRAPPPPAVWDFIDAMDTAFVATASADGQPYVQHRGGPPGFLVRLGPARLAFADLAGNRQYITVGNLTENGRLMMILVDFATRRRLKLWGRATLVEGPDLMTGPLAAVVARAAPARAERVVVVDLDVWDWNCRQHITPRFTETEWAAASGRTP